MADSMRDALTEAYAKHATEVEETPATPEAPAPEAAAPEVAAPQIDSAAAPEATTPPVKDGGEQSPPAAAASPVTAQPHDNKTNVTVQPATEPAKVAPTKPPRSWSAEAKAAFAALPEPVKNDVLRREKEISQGLENAAPARKHYESFQEVVKPFQPLFDAYGVRDPLPAIKELLTARATLEIGSPEQKAQFLANLVHEFGVDVAALDAFLVKRGPVAPFQPARPMPAPQRDPEVQALLDQFKQARLEKAEAAVAAVESLPHFEDLREDMADVVESFALAGKTISLESAYKRALAMNPDLEPAPAAVPSITKSDAARILASKAAASSISGTPRTGAKPSPTDRRDQIAAAWEANRAS